MQKYLFDAVVTVFAVLTFTVSVCATEDVKVNPHSDVTGCSVCHVASPEKLRGWFVFGSTKRAMKTDMNQLCLQCHTIVPEPEGSLGVGIGHAAGKKTAINHRNLPLASDGTITCATTCHNMHVTSDDRLQQLKHLRVPVNVLCVSCHDR